MGGEKGHKEQLPLTAEGQIKRIISLVEKMSGYGGYNYRDCFTKVLDVSLEAVRRLRMFDFDWQPELSSFEKYREMFYEIFAILQYANVYPEYTYEDIIGSTYERLGIANDRASQFFTPMHVARMMAQMTLGDVTLDMYTPERPMTICDPACGSGVMLLAAASVLPREFIDEGRVAFFGCDIDATCVKMCQLNMAIYGLDLPTGYGFVKLMNALTPQEVSMFPEPHKQRIIEDMGKAEQIPLFE